MARYLLGTSAFVAVVRQKPADPVKRWVDALHLHDDELFLSAVSVGELQWGVNALPANAVARSTWQRNLDDIVHVFLSRGCLLGFTLEGARRWAELMPLRLGWINPDDGADGELPTVRRQVVAQCLADALTLVEEAQPYHAALVTHGLAVVDPRTPPIR